jgi:hypothetical protein
MAAGEPVRLGADVRVPTYGREHRADVASVTAEDRRRGGRKHEHIAIPIAEVEEDARKTLEAPGDVRRIIPLGTGAR